jgi:hypothetical protein
MRDPPVSRSCGTRPRSSTASRAGYHGRILVVHRQSRQCSPVRVAPMVNLSNPVLVARHRRLLRARRHATVAPPSSEMKSRRLTARASNLTLARGRLLRCGIATRPRSAWGPNPVHSAMSAQWPVCTKADTAGRFIAHTPWHIGMSSQNSSNERLWNVRPLCVTRL